MTHGNQCVRYGDFNRMRNLNARVDELVDISMNGASCSAVERIEQVGIYEMLVYIPAANRKPRWVIQQENEGLE